MAFATGSALNKGKKKGVATSKPKYTPAGGKKVKGLSVSYVSETGTALATWSPGSLKHIDHYMCCWEYTVQTTAGVRTVYDSDSYSSTAHNAQSTFSVPAEALTVTCSVYPVSTQTKVLKWQTKKKKKYTSGDNKGKYYYEWTQHSEKVLWWTGAAVSATASTGASHAPEVPEAPVLSLGPGNAVSAAVSSEPHDSLKVHLALYTDGAWAVHSGGREIAIVDSGEVTLANAFAAAAGHAYKVDARQQNTATGAYSGYSGFSDALEMPPTAPSGLSVRSVTATAFLATWAKTNYTGDGFELRWAQDPTDLLLDELPDGAYSATTDGAESYSAQVAAGTWHFAVRGTYQGGNGAWSPISRFTSGLTPAAPTLGAMASYAALGDEVPVSWTYNNADGSTQTAFEVQVSIDGGGWETFASGQTSASVAAYPTAGLSGGESLQFRARTRGAVGEWSGYGYSTAVSVDPPLTVTLEVGDPTSLPLMVRFSADADVRLWHLLVKAAEGATVTGADGNEEEVAAGAVAFEGVIAAGDEDFDPREMDVALDLTDAQISDGVEYAATLDAISAHGLTDSDSKRFKVEWDLSLPEPTAFIPPVDDDYTAHVFPACYADEPATDPETGQPLMDADGNEVYPYRDDVTLAVYRIDADGTPLLVADGIVNDGTAEVLDPHPSFGTCWYRIAATSTTGAMGFADVPCEADFDLVVLQFEDGLRSYAGEFDAVGLIELPYGVSVSESYGGDASLVEFIGNSDPTLYTGTQLGRTVSTKATVLKTEDPEIMRKVRWLAGSQARAYYRDPTGLGFWAWVVPSVEHDGPRVASASFSVTRIEGDYSGAVGGAVV